MPRDAREVFGRLMALRAVLWRTQFELHLGRAAADRAEIEARHADLARWMAAARIPFSPRERALLDRPLGSWTPDEVSQLVWRNEAAAVLLWYLDLVPAIPPYGVPVPAAAVMERVEQLPTLGSDAPPTRPDAELAAALELASLWNWRARTEAFKRAGKPPAAGDSYEQSIKSAAHAAIESKLVEASHVADGDLLVGPGTRYAAADEKQQRTLACIADERHWALTWIADTSTAWDTVNPST
jgi:hypothetical protein